MAGTEDDEGIVGKLSIVVIADGLPRGLSWGDGGDAYTNLACRESRCWRKPDPPSCHVDGFVNTLTQASHLPQATGSSHKGLPSARALRCVSSSVASIVQERRVMPRQTDTRSFFLSIAGEFR